MKELALVPGCCCAPGAPLLDAEVAAGLADAFRALGDPTRVAIVNRLASAGEVCVCDLTEAFALSQPTVSHHLRILRDAGLVAVERRGRWAYYRVVPEAVGRLGAALRPVS